MGILIGGGYDSPSFNNNRIHHNFIHDNRQDGFGYGVEIDYGYAQIYSNIFQRNRHDIAGTGKKESGYEAFCNTVLEGGNDTNFDMHGEGNHDYSPNAGKFIHIHHNDFLDLGKNRTHIQNIMIRARPDVQCRIENNRFKHQKIYNAIKQTTTNPAINNNEPYPLGNMLVWNNIYDTNKYKGKYVKNKWNHFTTSNQITFPSTDQEEFSYSTGWQTYDQNIFEFGDVNADGYTDIYKVEYGHIYTIPFNPTYNDSWTLLLDTDYSFYSLKFGNFNSDPRTDVTVKVSNNIYLSDAIQNNWTNILTTSEPYSKFGDFDANGILDFFRGTMGNWYVSYNTNTAWSIINNSYYNGSSIILGNFDQNNKTDVFLADGTKWYISHDGTITWNYINDSGYHTQQLALGDVNGDGISDVILKWNKDISISGLGAWKALNTVNFPLSTFPFGNF